MEKEEENVSDGILPDRVHRSEGDSCDGVVCGKVFEFDVALRW